MLWYIPWEFMIYSLSMYRVCSYDLIQIAQEKLPTGVQAQGHGGYWSVLGKRLSGRAQRLDRFAWCMVMQRSKHLSHWSI